MQTNPAKAIREKCLDCAGGSSKEVKTCPASTCALHPFRFGKNPYRTRKEYSPEELEALRERAKSNLSKLAPTASLAKTTNTPAEGKDTTHPKNAAERITDAEKATK